MGVSAGWGAVKMFQVTVLTKILLLLCTLHSVNATWTCFFCLKSQVESGDNIRQCEQCMHPTLYITGSYEKKQSKWSDDQYVWKITPQKEWKNRQNDPFAGQRSMAFYPSEWSGTYRKNRIFPGLKDNKQTVESITFVLDGWESDHFKIFDKDDSKDLGASEITVHAEDMEKFRLYWDVGGKPGVSVNFKMPGIKNKMSRSYHTEPPATPSSPKQPLAILHPDDKVKSYFRTEDGTKSTATYLGVITEIDRPYVTIKFDNEAVQEGLPLDWAEPVERRRLRRLVESERSFGRRSGKP